jgi:nicotinate-nucleotide pyrophosphorylase (carboxylating)
VDEIRRKKGSLSLTSLWTDPKNLEEVTRVVDLAIREDTARGDLTSQTLFTGDSVSGAVVVSREKGVVAGIPVFLLVYDRLSGSVDCEALVKDGEAVYSGQELISLKGPTTSLLMGERTALNFLQRLSGIATLTRRFVARTSGYGITILDTRKTTPGLRLFEKYAVRVGGGVNHRFDLSEMVLIKDNHIAAAGGISPALERVMKKGSGEKQVEVEVKNLAELELVLKYRVNRIMLDNFTPEEVIQAVEIVTHSGTVGERPEIEISGRIGEDNIDSYCMKGVDFISIGGLTHSVRSLDISMELGEG